MQILFLSILGALVSVVLDMAWFGFFASAFYARHLPGLLRVVDGAVRPKLLPGALAYLLLALGITVFILPRVGTMFQAAALGALYGLVVFGVYEMTNMSILQGWSWSVVVFDILWGCIGCAAISCIIFAVAERV